MLPIAANILGWWRVNSQKFHTLAKMARDQLAMPVSIFAPRLDISAMITNLANLNPESMEALLLKTIILTFSLLNSKFASPSNVNEVALLNLDLDFYLREPLLPIAADILGWWRVNSQKLLTLAKKTTNPANLNPKSMEASVCSQNCLVTPKESKSLLLICLDPFI
ncbi:hypothetical protein Gotur_023642 [Gossypium turneri]